jgi:1,4-alpha-glucan branching enzyme
MVNTAKDNDVVASLPAKQMNMDEDNKTIIFERNNLIFLFNFHPTNSVSDYRFKVPDGGQYQIILNSDKKEFGGHERIDDQMVYPTVKLFGECFLSVYLPSRVALVLKKV